MLRYFLIYCALFVCSCKESRIKSEKFYLEPKANIKSVLDSFVKNTGDSYLTHAVYVNKTSPHEYELILYAGMEPLTLVEDNLNNQRATQKVLISNIEFDIYSGVEHYFKSKNMSDKAVQNSMFKSSSYVVWAVKDSFSVVRIYKLDGAYPFIAFPNSGLSNLDDFKPPTKDSTDR